VVWEYDSMACPQTIVRLYRGMMKAYVNQTMGRRGQPTPPRVWRRRRETVQCWGQGKPRDFKCKVTKTSRGECSGPWKPGSWCRPSKAHNRFGEAPGGGKLERGGNGEVSLRATWDQGGRDRTTQEEGFQVSKKGIKRQGDWQRELTREISKGSKRGIAPWSSAVNLCVCIWWLYECS
jgi:hypothetical protein